MSGADHYEVLNVERTASTAEIKSAYRKLVRQVHPDQGGNAALFRLVQEAWSTLSDPAKRAAYDRQLDSRSGTTTDEPPRTTRHEPDPAPEPEDPFTWSTDQPWASTPEEPQDEAPQEPLQPVDAGPIHASPSFGRWRVPALVALIGYTALIAWFVITSDYEGVGDTLLSICIGSMAVVALPPHWSRRLPLSAVLKVFGIATAAVFLLLLTVSLFRPSDDSVVGMVLVGVLVGGLVIVRLLTGRWSKYHALDKAIDRQAAYEFNLWGRPGEPLVDTTLAAPISQYDVMLQRRTANLLDPVVAALPAAKLVHGAQLGAMVVDHLLLNGHRAALILSLTGPPGSYSLDAYGGLQHNGQPYDSPAPALEAAVQSWRARLRQVDVHGFLIIRSDTGRVTTQTRPESTVTCLSTRTAAHDLLTWLRPEGNLVDRQILYDVLHRAPYGLI